MNPFTIKLALATVALASLLGGCASHQSGPYTSATEADRNTTKAEKLTREAAKLIATSPTKAEAMLRKALTADLYYGPAHNNLGVLYLKQDPAKLYEAAGEFEWARKLMPGHPDPRVNLALTLERAGRIDDAMNTYETALEVYPDYLPAVEAIARLQVRYNKQDERTPKYLADIATRADEGGWREWARKQMVEFVKSH